MNPSTQKIKYGPEELIDVIKDISPKDYKILITAKENDKSEFDRLISLWDDGVIIEQFFEMTKTLKDDDLKKLKELGLSKIYPNYKTQKIDDVIKGDDDENKRMKIQLPGNNRQQCEFVTDASVAFKNNDLIFYRRAEDIIIEIKEFYDSVLQKDIFGFREVRSKRFYCVFERLISTYNSKIVNNQFVETEKSATEQSISLMMKDDDLIKSLNEVERFFNYIILYEKNKKLRLSERGYNKYLKAFFTVECPKVEYLEVEEAKEIINDILKEFCFKDDIDKTMAIAYLLTPACRTLYSNLTSRTPLFILSANRPGAGKDYLAEVVSSIYEGKYVEGVPISTDDGKQNTEELRKRITACMMYGKRLFHSGNNKGHINNAILEGLITKPIWQDRILGKSEMGEWPNEMDYSLSGNVGLTFPGDLGRRVRTINLFYGEEDINKRKFERPNLISYVLNNRGLVLSAIYTLIKNWFDGGKPSFNSVFASFYEWANIVGGVMIYNELGDPCVKLEQDMVSGDRESEDMKIVYETYYNIHGESPFTISEIREFIMELETERELNLFSNIDLIERSGQTKFGKMFPIYVNRKFSNIELKINKKGKRASRTEYYFVLVTSGNIGNYGLPSLLKKEKI